MRSSSASQRPSPLPTHLHGKISFLLQPVGYRGGQDVVRSLDLDGGRTRCSSFIQEHITGQSALKSGDGRGIKDEEHEDHKGYHTEDDVKILPSCLHPKRIMDRHTTISSPAAARPHQRPPARVAQDDDGLQVWELGAVGQRHEEQVQDGERRRGGEPVLQGLVPRKSPPCCFPSNVIVL